MLSKVKCENITESGIPNCKYCFGMTPALKILNEKQLNLVEEAKITMNFKAGETIFKKGTVVTHSVSFSKGLAVIFDEKRNGPINLYYIKPVTLINGFGMLYDGMHHYSVKAVTNSSCCYIPTELIMRLMDENKAFAKYFYKDIQKLHLQIQDHQTNILSKKNAGRIADCLLYFANEIFQSNIFTLPISRKEFRNFAVVSPDSMNKIIAQFVDAEIISWENDKIEIVNKKILSKISTFG